MIKHLLVVIISVVSMSLSAQHPIVYVGFVSHNEPLDNLQALSNFDSMQTKVLQLAQIMDANGAKWNLQTCDGFARGALQFQGVNSNIFKTITSGQYADNIEIDPRPKVQDTVHYNIADTYHYLDSLGCHPTHTLGGFVYFTNNASMAPIDWFKYQDTITGKMFHNQKWKAELMWGAGSNPPHAHDYNDYGIWKPDTVSYAQSDQYFGQHNPNRNVWFIGNGCQPLQGFDPSENEQTIISELKNFIDSVQNNHLPQDKFYVYSITINQSGFGSQLFGKINTICDSINSWGTNKVQWAKLSEKFNAFQQWQSNPDIESQWKCGSAWNGLQSIEESTVSIYPNPANSLLSFEADDSKQHQISIIDMYGKMISEMSWFNQHQLDISSYTNGMYIIQLDNKFSSKLTIFH